MMVFENEPKKIKKQGDLIDLQSNQYILDILIKKVVLVNHFGQI